MRRNMIRPHADTGPDPRLSARQRLSDGAGPPDVRRPPRPRLGCVLGLEQRDSAAWGDQRLVLQGMAITVPFGVPMFAIIAFFMGGFQAMSAWGLAPWIWMTLAGVLHFIIGRFGNYKATQLLGSTLSTPIQQLSILVALLLAFVFLGETINLVNLAGIALVILGPMAVVQSRQGRDISRTSKGVYAAVWAGPVLGRGLRLRLWHQPAVHRPWHRRRRHRRQRWWPVGVLYRRDCRGDHLGAGSGRFREWRTWKTGRQVGSCRRPCSSPRRSSFGTWPWLSPRWPLWCRSSDCPWCSA